MALMWPALLVVHDLQVPDAGHAMHVARAPEPFEVLVQPMYCTESDVLRADPSEPEADVELAVTE